MEIVGKSRPKVCIIDDMVFVFACVSEYLEFCQVKHEYAIPEDESTLAEYDVLIVDGDGIGNSKYKHGMEFCKAYAKQGNNKVVIYHSGLRPSKDDEKILIEKGVKVVVKGRDPQILVDAVREGCL